MRRPTLVVVPLLLALALTGCTGGDDSYSTGSPAGGSAGADSAGSAAEPAAPAEPGAGAAPGAPAAGASAPDRSAPLGRAALAGTALIRTAELGVRVDDVRVAADRAVDITVAATGVVTSEQSTGEGDDSDASLLLRVPPDRFDQVVRELAALGTEVSRTVGVEDVTDQVVDLESRLATQRASVERVRALLEEAESLAEVVQIEAELTRRTADLESLQARLAALEARVDLSSVTLDLFSDATAPQEQDEVVGFLDGLEGGWAAFLATARVLGATVGALVPFLPVLLLGALAWRLRSRRAAAGST